MMFRARRGLVLPATVAFVLLFIASAHVFSSPDNWSEWSAVNDEKTANIPHEAVAEAPVHPPIPAKASPLSTSTSSTSSLLPVASAVTPIAAITTHGVASITHDVTYAHTTTASDRYNDYKEEHNSTSTSVEQTAEKPVETPCPAREPSLLELASQAEPIPDLNITFNVPDDIKYDPAGPRPEQVVILTAADRGGHHGTIENMHERVAENRKTYCEHHGYNYHFVDISEIELPNAHAVWKKIPAIVKTFNAFPDAQWVVVLDLDMIIMEPEQDLNSLILSPSAMEKQLLFGTEMVGSNNAHTGSYTNQKFDWKNTDFIIAQDHNGINAGAFFVRRSVFSQLLMDMWVDPFFLRNNWGGPEQDAMRHLARHHPVVRNHFGLMKQRVVNAFYEGPEEMAWQEGDLLVHFAGCWVNDSCAERFEEMWAKRKTLPSKASTGSVSFGELDKDAVAASIPQEMVESS